MVALLSGAVGAVVLSGLGGIVAGEASCDLIFSVDSTATTLATAIFIGAFGGVVGLAVGGLIAGFGVAFSSGRNTMAVGTVVIALIVASADGPFNILGSFPLNSNVDHDRCISAALMGGFVGASLGMLLGVYFTSRRISPRFLLGSFTTVGAIAVLAGLLLWKYVGWEQ